MEWPERLVTWVDESLGLAPDVLGQVLVSVAVFLA
jgi:hypothetical protein